jgi:hypothetical protein
MLFQARLPTRTKQSGLLGTVNLKSTPVARHTARRPAQPPSALLRRYFFANGPFLHSVGLWSLRHLGFSHLLFGKAEFVAKTRLRIEDMNLDQLATGWTDLPDCSFMRTAHRSLVVCPILR